MSNKIDAIDSTKSAKQVKVEKEDKAAKAEETQKEESAKKAEKTDSFETSKSTIADYKIKEYVKTYIENLIIKYEGYDDIISRLRSYLGNFDIDKFRKEYTNVSSNSDLATALYNETMKFL